MNLIKLYEKDDLDDVIEFVSQKEFITHIKEWLKEQNININTKVFISHYLLWKFNIFHGVPNNSPLYETCGIITEAVKNNQKIQDIDITNYKNYFNMWKEAHADDMIDEYTETIEKLKEFEEAEPAPENKEGYKLFQDTLEKSVDMLKRTRARGNTI